MKDCLGIYVGRDGVTAVLARAGAVVWHEIAAVARAELPDRTLLDVGSRVPWRRGRRRAVVIALGSSVSQFKQLAGVPAGAQADVLAKLVRENYRAFFITGWASSGVAGFERRADGTCWATAYDADVVRAVVDALVPKLARRVSFAASPVAIARAITAGPHLCEGDGLTHRIHTIEGGWIEGATRAALLPAYGAAMLALHPVGAWPMPSRGDGARVMSRVALVLAACAAMVSATASLLAPGLRAAWILEHARHSAIDRRRASDVAKFSLGLRKTSAQLASIARFQASRGTVTRLLGDLTQSLPDSTAIIGLRVDSTGGSVVVLTRHAADVLPQLVSLAGVRAPRLVGSITRETRSSRQMERATIRFDRPREMRAGDAPRALTMAKPVR